MTTATTYQSSEPIHSPSRNRLDLNDRSFHDWYRFVLSFPPHLVKHYLDAFDPPAGSKVLDPFCGTGTTLVEGMKNGFNVVGIEANPVAHLASSVKTSWSLDPTELEDLSRAIAKNVRTSLTSSGIKDSIADDVLNEQRTLYGLRDLDDDQRSLILRDSISPLPLHRTLELLASLPEGFDGTTGAMKLALAKGLVGPIGNLHFGPEVGVVRKKRVDAPVIDIWLQNVIQQVEDLRSLEKTNYPISETHLADSRTVIETIPDKSIGALFTSPPYPNEKDYTRTTRLESVLLGFISNKKELRNLKQGLLRSNTRNIYASDADHEIGLKHDRIRHLCDQIEARRKDLGKTSGFEKLYWKVTAAYFGGMERHLESLKRILIPGAQLGYVVGDQASYFRIPIQTGEILAQVAETVGYKVVSIDLFRTRLATATKQQLREEVVVLEWCP